MAVSSANLNDLYSDIVADLIPYYDNAVLLPNPGLIVNSYNLEGSVGNTVKIPVTNAYGTANVSIADNASILTLAGTNSDFDPSNVSLSVVKRGTGSRVSTESLEDGGQGTVAGATTTRLARSIAQSTDIAGFRVMLTGAETALTDISDINVTNDGYANTALGSGCELAVVFSPEAGAYAVKRQPEVKMFEDIDTDSVEFVATLRNGFAQVKTDYIRAIATEGLGAASAQSASLDQFATSIANLRNNNAPTDAGGFYIACITPGQELHLSKELNGVGGIASGSIGSVAQLAANDALMQGLVSVAVGARFVRSNNLPTGLASA